MEGLNRPGFQLWFLAILVFGITVLAALGLLIAGRTRAARILLAAGLLGASAITAVGTLTFVDWDFNEQQINMLLVVTALAFLLAGAGQFIAALRSPWIYAAALGCVALSQVTLWAAMMAHSDRLHGVLGGRLFEHRLPVAVASLLLAGASVLIAVFCPSGARQTETRNPGASERT
jgi:hypothetical protein